MAELDLGPAQDLFNDEIIEIDNKGEMPGLDFLLNCDIRMFCSPLISEFISTADWQLCCAEQLTQLDISYCDLLPDLYKNLPQVIEVEASCSSGSGLYCSTTVGFNFPMIIWSVFHACTRSYTTPCTTPELQK